MDPTIINGGVINSFDNSAKLGKSEWSILESDESDGSFVKVPSTYAVVTNIDREHMDYYNSLDDLKRHFIKFMKNVPLLAKHLFVLMIKIIEKFIDQLKLKIYLLTVLINILTSKLKILNILRINHCLILK